MASKPTLIFCPGAWYPPTAFDPLIAKFPTYTTHTVAFPSIQQATTVQDLQPDITTIRTLVEQESNAGNDVIVISHSWSGLPVNSALEGLSKPERQSSGQPGGVTKLVFISAFIPEVGESLIGAFGGVAPDWYLRDEPNGTVSAKDPYTLFFHDSPEGEYWAQTLRPHAWATKNSPATDAAYVRIPAAYLMCENDRAIPLFVQELMVEKARQKGAQIETETVKTGHSPWLVDPEPVAVFIRKHVGEAA
ncbi:alpha/beta-hydrolase [Aspergillus ellipticus CBS 707.79]|uniref:Alpha/beta-hydrolase n=1 Tax=Aspergillus ellipticus CBS 707.79 TaxID=1448320 RepID=A0A319DTR8_9EURO|nr:alpha/beta-hydrolase [Aspergillus ellipticus CBS 707.79]